MASWPGVASRTRDIAFPFYSVPGELIALYSDPTGDCLKVGIYLFSHMANDRT